MRRWKLSKRKKTGENYVPTADQINSTVPIAQIPRPSSTTAWSGLYATCSRDASPLAYGWVAIELIGYWSVQKCYPDHTRSLHDHFPINSIAARLFWHSKIIVYRKPDRCRPPQPLARPVLESDRLIGLDRVDLIGSENPALGKLKWKPVGRRRHEKVV